MGVIVATTAGLMIWIILWAIGNKPLDAFLLTVLIALVAVMVRMVTAYLPGNRAPR
jgi:hypothetical protein